MATTKKPKSKRKTTTALLAPKANRRQKPRPVSVLKPKVIDGELVDNPLDWRVDALREMLEVTKIRHVFAATSDVLTPILMMLGAFVFGVGKKAAGVAPFLETFQSRLATQLEGVDPTKLVPPPPRIAGPLLAQYVFVEDDADLRVLFEKLLATAVNSDTRESAHPAFVEILKQLSPTEARLMKGLATILSQRRSHMLPYLEARAEATTLPPNYMVLGSISPLDALDVKFNSTAISNLERLGIFKVELNKNLNPGTDAYAELRALPIAKRFATAATNMSRKLELQIGIIEVCQFGLAFIDACVMKLERTTFPPGGSAP